MPLIVVGTPREIVRVVNETPPILERRLEVIIEAVGSSTEEIAGQMDQLALQIERTLDQNPSCSDLVSDLTLQKSEIEIDHSGEGLIASLKLTYEITYYSESGAIINEELEGFNLDMKGHKSCFL